MNVFYCNSLDKTVSWHNLSLTAGSAEHSDELTHGAYFSLGGQWRPLRGGDISTKT